MTWWHHSGSPDQLDRIGSIVARDVASRFPPVAEHAGGRIAGTRLTARASKVTVTKAGMSMTRRRHPGRLLGVGRGRHETAHGRPPHEKGDGRRTVPPGVGTGRPGVHERPQGVDRRRWPGSTPNTAGSSTAAVGQVWR